MTVGTASCCCAMAPQRFTETHQPTGATTPLPSNLSFNLADCQACRRPTSLQVIQSLSSLCDSSEKVTCLMSATGFCWSWPTVWSFAIFGSVKRAQMSLKQLRWLFLAGRTQMSMPISGLMQPNSKPLSRASCCSCPPPDIHG